MEYTIPQILNILKKKIVFLIIFAILFGAAAFGYSYKFVDPIYTTQMRLIVEYPEGISTSSDITLMRRMVITFIDILNTTNYTKIVKENCDTNLSVAEIKRCMVYTYTEESEAFTLQISCKDYKDCANITKAVSGTIKQYVDAFYGYKLSIATIESPSAPYEIPIPYVRNTLLGAVVGLLLAAAISILRSIYDITIKNEEELSQHYDLPILGTVPSFSSKRKVKSTGRKDEKNEK